MKHLLWVLSSFLLCISFSPWTELTMAEPTSVDKRNGYGSLGDKNLDGTLLPEENEPTQDPRIKAQLARKSELCAKDLYNTHAPLRLLHVTPAPNPLSTRSNAVSTQKQYPRILCFVNTISTHLATRAQAIADTWAQRCDLTLFFSNGSDTLTARPGTPQERTFQVIQLNVNAAYHHLWDKHKASLQYVYDHYRHDYDWFYKADDDAYVILENLRTYLVRPEILMNVHRHPMQMGHRFNMTYDAASYYIRDEDVRAEWWNTYDRLIFNSGGCGYIMNRFYLNKFIQSIPERTCMSDEASVGVVADDVAISFCMAWHDVFPWDTKDYLGRERWHAFNPQDTYGLSIENAPDWWKNYHTGIGGFRGQDDCCAPDSIGYHYVRPELMYHMERQLYFCRTGDDIPDIDAFNQMYDLSIGKGVGIHPDEQ